MTPARSIPLIHQLKRTSRDDADATLAELVDRLLGGGAVLWAAALAGVPATLFEKPAAKLLDGKSINYPAFIWNRAVRLLLRGVASNRDAIGARVTAKYGGHTQSQELTAQSSFYSANDRRLHFGLGAATSADLTG